MTWTTVNKSTLKGSKITANEYKKLSVKLNKPEKVSFAQRNACRSATPIEAKYSWYASSLSVQMIASIHAWNSNVLLQRKSDQSGQQNSDDFIPSQIVSLHLPRTSPSVYEWNKLLQEVTDNYVAQRLQEHIGSTLERYGRLYSRSATLPINNKYRQVQVQRDLSHPKTQSADK